MVEVIPMTIAEAVGHAQNSGDVQALAAAVLSHPGSVALPRDVILACARVAFARHASAAATSDIATVRDLATVVLETELTA